MHAYFDCFCGISGDMTLGAMIDLGVPAQWLSEQLCTVLPPSDFTVTVDRNTRSGIQAMNVTVQDNTKAHARDYKAIRRLVIESGLPASVKETGLAIFSRIAAAEAEIHGRDIDAVHFHEVGGVDAIVDILGTALCVQYLGIRTITASSVPLGSGFVTCSHGTLPVPAPATLKILKGLPVIGTDIQSELTTPSGAAIIATLARAFGPMPEMIVHKIGYGAGKRDVAERPNLLRVVTGEPASAEMGEDRVIVIETAIDDMNPEIFGYAMEKLFEAGALDVCMMPVQMKKNRPGTLLQVLCRDQNRKQIIERLFFETTTSGVRYYDARREILHRESREVETRYGRVRAKAITQPDGAVRMAPEYESCREIAAKQGIPIKTVYEQLVGDLSGAV